MCREVTSAVPRRPAIKQECLDYFLMFGERHLNHLPDESVSYYNSERAHACRHYLPPCQTDPQLENNVPNPDGIVCRKRLGG